MFSLIVLLLALPYVPALLTSPSSLTCQHPENLKSLYHDYICRSEPLFVCQEFGSGLAYRLPSEINCDQRIIDAHRVEKFTVFPYYADNDRTTTAIHCHSRMYGVGIDQDLFNEISMIRTDLGTLSVLFEECEKKRDQRLSPNNFEDHEYIHQFHNKLQRLRAGEFGTNNHGPPINPGSLRHGYSEYLNYFTNEVEIMVDHTNNHIRSNLALNGTCLFEDGQCPTENGILIWKVPDKPECYLKEGNLSFKLKKCFQKESVLLNHFKH